MRRAHAVVLLATLVLSLGRPGLAPAELVLTEEQGREEFSALYSLVVSPGGQFLYASESDLDVIIVFASDPSYGGFTEVGRYAPGIARPTDDPYGPDPTSAGRRGSP